MNTHPTHPIPSTDPARSRLSMPVFLALIAATSIACGELTDPAFVDSGLTEGVVQDVVAGGNSASAAARMFKVRIENVSPVYEFTTARGFNRPWNVFQPGPLLPGQTYAFTFDAHPGHRLSFATMFVHSNDLFYAPNGDGIELWTEEGRTMGDITDQIMLWDAGTEVNQEPGTGADQPLQGGGASGDADPDPNVRLATDDFDNLPEVSDVISVTLDSLGATTFRLAIENVSDGMTLKTADGAYHPTPLAPGVFVVHTAPNPLFTEGEPDRGEGLEGLAEGGDIAALVESVRARTGLTSPIAPGVYVSHAEAGTLFVAGEDASAGLEALAEDGNPVGLGAELEAAGVGTDGGAFAVPTGGEAPAPAFPGQAYEFMVMAEDGDYLSFATMLVQSNDLFYAPSDMGVALFKDGEPVDGDITDMIMLWDAGTEFNERPGIGLSQAPRQSGPNTGPEESKPVEVLDPYYRYPAVSDVIKVTVTPMEG